MTVFGSFERQTQPALLLARGLAGCALTGADFSQLNPASIASTPSVCVSLFHSPSPFDLPELSNGGIALTLPARFGTVQAAALQTGKDLYREQTVMLAYGLALDATIVIGATISYNALSIEGYGSARTFGVDLGIQVAPVPFLTLGASVLNVNRPTIGTEQDELPRIVLFGAAYKLSDNAVLSADIVKDIRFPESVRAGIEVRPLAFIALRTGISSQPSRFHAGAGVMYKSVEFDYGLATHEELGITQSIGLRIAL